MNPSNQLNTNLRRIENELNNLIQDTPDSDSIDNDHDYEIIYPDRDENNFYIKLCNSSRSSTTSRSCGSSSSSYNLLQVPSSVNISSNGFKNANANYKKYPMRSDVSI